MILGNNFYSFTKNVDKNKVKKTEDGYILLISVPQVKKEDLDIEIEKNFIRIKLEKADYDFIEPFTVTYSISSDIEISKITAKIEDGVLIVKFPYDQKILKTKKIVVN